MNCRKVYRNLSAYNDKLLSPEKARKLEQHLRDCPECMQKWREFFEIVRAAGYLQVQKPSGDFNQRLLGKVAAIRFKEVGAYQPARGNGWPAYVLAFAGLTVALLVFLTFPFLSRNEVDSVALAPTEVSAPLQGSEAGALLTSQHSLESDDSLWQLLGLGEAGLLRAPNPERLTGETRVLRSYVLPLIDMGGNSSYGGESYLLTPVSSGGSQSTDVVF